MKNIRINKYIRLKLVELGELGESADHVLSRLLDDIDADGYEQHEKRNVGMRVSDETYQKLKSKQGEGETLIKTIERAIETFKE